MELRIIARRKRPKKENATSGRFERGASGTEDENLADSGDASAGELGKGR